MDRIYAMMGIPTMGQDTGGNMSRPRPTQIEYHAVIRFRERHGQTSRDTPGPFWHFNPLTRKYVDLALLTHGDVSNIIAYEVSRSVDLTPEQRMRFGRLSYMKRGLLGTEELVRFDDMVYVVKKGSIVITSMRIHPDDYDVLGINCECLGLYVGRELREKMTSERSFGDSVITQAQIEDAFRRILNRDDCEIASGEQAWKFFGSKSTTSSATAYGGIFNANFDGENVQLMVVFLLSSVGAQGSKPLRRMVSRCLTLNDDRVDDEEEEVEVPVPVPTAPSRRPKKFTLHGYQANVWLSENVFGADVRKLSLKYAKFASGCTSLKQSSLVVQSWRLDLMRAMPEARVLKDSAFRSMTRGVKSDDTVGIIIPATDRMEVGWKTLLVSGVIRDGIVRLSAYMQSATPMQEYESMGQLEPKPNIE